jgi:CRP-like cAMP-binding protein
MSSRLQQQLQDAGLNVFSCCEKLDHYGADLLKVAPLLQDMTAAEADILGAAMLLVRAPAGQVLIREGDTGEWMMLLLKGTVDITKRMDGQHGPQNSLANPAVNAAANAAAYAALDGSQDPQAAFSRIAVIQRGAAFGEMSMLDSNPRYASCTVIEAAEVGVLGHHEIALLIRDHPAVGAKLLVKITQLMAQRLRNTSNQLVQLLREKKTKRRTQDNTGEAA